MENAAVICQQQQKKSVRKVATNNFLCIVGLQRNNSTGLRYYLTIRSHFPSARLSLTLLTRPSAYKGRGESSRCDGRLSQLTGLRSIGFAERWEKLVDISFGTLNRQTQINGAYQINPSQPNKKFTPVQKTTKLDGRSNIHFS